MLSHTPLVSPLFSARRSMRRREFIALLFGPALARSRDALGQASAKVYRLGSLDPARPLSANSPDATSALRRRWASAEPARTRRRGDRVTATLLPHVAVPAQVSSSQRVV